MRLLLFLLMGFSSFSQQNLFNVPSSEITEKGGTFFQEQLNFGNGYITSNATLDFGMKNNFELGLNFLNCNYEFNEKSFEKNNYFLEEGLNNMLLFNAQKSLYQKNFFEASIGTQAGTTIANGAAKFVNFNYLNTSYTFLNEKVSLYLGSYFANKNYTGLKDQTNIMYGFDTEIAKKLHIMGDHISGTHSLGVSVLGFVYYVKPNVPLSFGFQFRNKNAVANNAFVFELTLLPKKSKA